MPPNSTQIKCRLPLLALLHSTEPAAMPMENNVSIKLNTLALPPKCSCVNVSSCVVYTAPTSQNHEMPKMAVRNSFCARICRHKSFVSRHKFQWIFACGFCGGADGINRLLANPAAATTNTTTVSTVEPCPAIAVPRIWPNKIARNVPDSIRPLPVSKCFSPKYSGRMAYFTGPKIVECTPIRNRHSNSSGADETEKPQPANAIIAISNTLTARASRALSKRVASCPASVENRKYGSTNSSAPKFSICSGGSQSFLPNP